MFPSSSGRVVSHHVRLFALCVDYICIGYNDVFWLPFSWTRNTQHTQRNDKVVLFKKLREDLEPIKAGTFDSSSMQLVSLVRQGA